MSQYASSCSPLNAHVVVQRDFCRFDKELMAVAVTRLPLAAHSQILRSASSLTQLIALNCMPWHNFTMQTLDDRMLVRVQHGKWVVVEIDDVFWLEADGATTMVRLRGRDRICDKRTLGEVMDGVERLGFLRIHRQHAVNLRRVTEVRRRSDSQDWEVKLDPPVNRVLAVSRGRLMALWEALGRKPASGK